AGNPHIYRLERELSRVELIAELASMPERLRAVLAGTTPDALTARESTDEWSAFQTLCHLRDATLVYAARFRWIVFDDRPVMPNFNEEQWVLQSRDTVDDVPTILGEIAASRSDLVRVLSRMPPEAWQRSGIYSVAGIIVLEEYVRHAVVHEGMHLQQIAEALRLAAR
ncbi:MAG: DinB family protein, partial [Dehalococcoidia bacterium]|nr:DinB family protein [Dehalococcoidia bacterium]